MRRARACPDCAVAMHTLLVAGRDGREVELDGCHQCGSLWFDAGEIERVTGRTFSFDPLGATTARHCPACEQPMAAGVSRHGVPVERCAKCQGTFLDVDDLRQMKLKLERAHARPQVRAFVCAGCGGRFEMREGNATAKGLVCRACVVNPTIDVPKPGWLDRYAPDATEDSPFVAQAQGFDWLF